LIESALINQQINTSGKNLSEAQQNNERERFMAIYVTEPKKNQQHFKKKY
jgi:uncharacterized protein YvpB